MTDEKCETVDIKKLPKLDDKTTSSIKTELSTGLSLAIVYFIFIFSVPAMNWFKPEWAFAKMYGGMSFSWFLTTIAAMAMAFIIAYLHTKLYERWEKKTAEQENDKAKKGRHLDDANLGRSEVPLYNPIIRNSCLYYVFV